MVFEKVYDALEPLGIPVVRSFYKGEAKSYVIVSVYDEKPFNVFDNSADDHLFNFKVTYWRDAHEKDLSFKILKLLKENKFNFIYSADLFDEGYYGKALDFQKVISIKELEESDKEEEGDAEK